MERRSAATSSGQWIPDFDNEQRKKCCLQLTREYGMYTAWKRIRVWDHWKIIFKHYHMVLR